MIVKLQTGIGQWSYFEGDEVRLTTFQNYRKEVMQIQNCETYLRGVFNGTDEDINSYLDKLEVTVISFIKGDKTFQVATDFPGYLMNDNGKTIDRIN